MALSGPLFWSADDGIFKSITNKQGGHYNIFNVKPENGMAALRHVFPDGEADDMNFCLFSTSGVHGHYGTIEEAANLLRNPKEEESQEITFLIIQPRLVALRYGNCKPQNMEDINFLRRLRKTSHDAIARIGL